MRERWRATRVEGGGDRIDEWRGIQEARVSGRNSGRRWLPVAGEGGDERAREV